MRTVVSAVIKETFCLLGREHIERFTRRLYQRFPVPGLSAWRRRLLTFEKASSMGLEVRRVWRQVEHLAARVLIKLPDLLTLVHAEVVHHHQLPALVLPPSPTRKAEEKRAGILRDSSSFLPS